MSEKVIRWKVVAGPNKLHFLQTYDLLLEKDKKGVNWLVGGKVPLDRL